MCEKGYEAATISNIAKRAGVADGTIYKYVADKRELLFRVLSKSIGVHVEQTIEGARALRTPQEKIEYFCYRHLSFWDQNRELGLLYAAESRTRDQHHWPTYLETNRKYVKVIQDAIEEGVRNGDFVLPAPPRILRDAIMGRVEQLAWGLTSRAKTIDPRRMASEIVACFVIGIKSKRNAALVDVSIIDRLENAVSKVEKFGKDLNAGKSRS